MSSPRPEPPTEFAPGVPRVSKIFPIWNDTLRHWVSWCIQRFFLLPAVFVIYRLFNRVTVHGAENFDAVGDQSFLICPNHTSAWDGPISHVFIASSLRRFLSPNIHWTVLADPVRMVFTPVARFCIWMGIIPVDRKEGIEQFALQDAMRVLTTWDRQVAMVIYPEGTRSKDGWLAKKGKLGAGWFARRARVPVIPLYHVNVPGMPSLFKKIEIHVGPPIDLDEYLAMPDDPPTWNGTSKAIMAELRAMEERIRGPRP